MKIFTLVHWIFGHVCSKKGIKFFYVYIQEFLKQSFHNRGYFFYSLFLIRIALYELPVGDS